MTKAATVSETETRRRTKPRPERLFFPAAALLALIVVGLKAASYSGAIDLSTLPLYWHGHEMLLGFASAMMGGYLLSSSSKARIKLAFIAWLLGRTAIFVPALPVALQAAMLLAYPFMLALFAGGAFVKAAKGWRNLIFPIILAALTLAEGLYLLGRALPLPAGSLHGIVLAADLVLIMLFTMGGRLIAAATSGAHQAIGQKLHRTAHQDLERAGLFILLPMAFLDTTNLAAPLSGLASLAAMTIIFCRLWRWRIWQIVRQWSVSSLHMGYLWLAVGLGLKGWAQMTTTLPVTEALHPAFIGGLGMLGMTVMTRTRLQRDRLRISLGTVVPAALLLIMLSASARMLAFAPALRTDALWASAGLWCTGFGLFCYTPAFRRRGAISKGAKPMANNK